MGEPMQEVPGRDWWVVLGMAVSATAAAVSSFAGLRGLAVVAGWPVVLASLWPLSVDSWALTATRVWLATSTRSVRARQFARGNAAMAIGLSVGGNAVAHAIAVGLVHVSWLVVVGVGAVPPLVLGAVSHLAVLWGQLDPAGPESVPGAVPLGPEPDWGRTGDDSRYRSEDELTRAARAVDAVYRATHGHPMSRDELRRTLRVGGARATAVARRLKQERATSQPIVGD
jgi:hypothetical protein